MKKIAIIFLFIGLAIGCESEGFNNRNPYIPNVQVNWMIDLSLPLYSNLSFVSNHATNFSQGVRGVVIFNTGSGFVAFEMACPNQELSSCSTMTIDGINVVCPCDEAEYSLFSGQSQGKQYPLKQYRVEVNGNSLLVYN